MKKQPLTPPASLHVEKISSLIAKIEEILAAQEKAYRTNNLAEFNMLNLKKEKLSKVYYEATSTFLKTLNIKEALGTSAPLFLEKVKAFDEKIDRHILMMSVGLEVRKKYMDLFKKSLLPLQKPFASTYTRQGYRCSTPKRKLAISLSMNAAI